MDQMYANITIRGPQQNSLLEFLKGKKRSTAVSPTINDLTVILDPEFEKDEKNLWELAQSLSEYFNCISLGILVTRFGSFSYKLYDSGNEADTYCSEFAVSKQLPEGHPSTGNAALLCELFNPEQDIVAVANVLQKPYAFEIDRHHDFVQLLKLSNFAIGLSFQDLFSINDWELPGISLFRITSG